MDWIVDISPKRCLGPSVAFRPRFSGPYTIQTGSNR